MKLILKLLKRIEKLEKAVYAAGSTRLKAKQKKPADEYRGATGGIRLLIHEGFFSNKRAFQEIRAKLTSKGYHYSRQAIQSALSGLVTRERSLIVLEEKGRKVYAKRK